MDILLISLRLKKCPKAWDWSFLEVSLPHTLWTISCLQLWGHVYNEISLFSLRFRTYKATSTYLLSSDVFSSSSIWDLRTLNTQKSFNVIQYCHHIICLKNHRMPLRSTLLQWKPSHVYISGSRHSQWFRLNLTQIISRLKTLIFYVPGSEMHRLSTDPIFPDLIYIGLYYLYFSLGHQNPPLRRTLGVGSQGRFGVQAHRHNNGRALPSPARAFISSDPCMTGI